MAKKYSKILLTILFCGLSQNFLYTYKELVDDDTVASLLEKDTDNVDTNASRKNEKPFVNISTESDDAMFDEDNSGTFETFSDGSTALIVKPGFR